MKRILPAVGAFLLVAGAVAGCAAPEVPDSGESAQSPAPSQTAAPTPQPTPSFPYPVYTVGQPFEFESMGLTVNSFEVTDEIVTNDGGVLTASPGEDLVLVRTLFVNLGNDGQDLSCAGINGVFIDAYDVEGRSMEPLFESSRIPGNPECNFSLLSGQKHDYNFALRMIEGSQPLAISFTETRTFDDMVFFNFTDRELTLGSD